LFFFGMLEHGPRGVEIQDDHVAEENLPGYGVDWEDLDNPAIRRHHDEANIIETFGDDVADDPLHQHPEHLSRVDVEEPDCFLTTDQVDFLDSQLAAHDFMHSNTIVAYRLRWLTVIDVCKALYVV
jgi:hypothetical protein